MGRTPAVILIVVLASCVQVSLATWGTWSAWSTCSLSCGTGSTTRNRTCSTTCASGDASETQACTVMNYCIPSYYGNTDRSCSVDEFGCATGVTTCVNMTLRCDGNQDCEDGSDENPFFTTCTTVQCSGAKDVSQSAAMTLVLMAFTALLQTM